MKDSNGITVDVLNDYRTLARYNYDCGDYQSARIQLATIISLSARPPVQSLSSSGGGTNNDDEQEELLAAASGQQQQQQQQNKAEIGNPHMYYLQSVDTDILELLWGRLACEILVEDWEAASIGVEAVKTAMEIALSTKKITALQALQQRTWLLHWSLFVYWNDSSAKGGLEQLVEMFHSDKYKQAITTVAPHLLRYLTAAVLLCKRRVTYKKSKDGTSVASTAVGNAEARKLMKNLIYVMQDCEYSDPIVEFVNCLCVKFDFDSAQLKLAECEKVLAADFFLCHQTELFMEEARVFVFENYCRIHNKIDLKALGEKLAMDQDNAERWIVDLIRNAPDLDAKIDHHDTSSVGAASHVVMGSGAISSIYEQVMDKTRDLNMRSATLGQNLLNSLNETKKERMKQLREGSSDE
jgi:translation initiation factor 3 subunit E